MNMIIQNYNLLVNDYQLIEDSLTEADIQKKREILSSIFSILASCQIKPAQVKNAVLAHKLLEKTKCIQAQIVKLQSVESSLEAKEYLDILVKRKLKLEEKLHKFSKRKKLKFPAIKKKEIDKDKIYRKFDKYFYKIIERLSIESIEDAEDILSVQVKFNKFQTIVDVLSYIDNIDRSKLVKLRLYQEAFEEILYFEALIQNMKKFYKKEKLTEENVTETLELNQNILIERLDSQKEELIADCRAVILLK
ncbi:hypothetical protein Palpr_1754 [Paludibacter propionicigenes WB4]|uniref:CHAD domain-containing protein n=1 Tax=Paludibacter propionicigenes (strain DSM 17365 / JCM 13257 / WB4) TaxID=694427 RepID=E4T599_PALPW|nr:hypothetical protein [Paludibacter propionicigenes]ADQ79893.1 hypothetical protein Palpr_1754 [Paludibacter propionicigenes WB4]